MDDPKCSLPLMKSSISRNGKLMERSSRVGLFLEKVGEIGKKIQISICPHVIISKKN